MQTKINPTFEMTRSSRFGRKQAIGAHCVWLGKIIIKKTELLHQHGEKIKIEYS